MSTEALARKLIASLGETLTVTDLQLDEATASCALVFDGNLIVNIEYDDPAQRLLLSAWLHELPAEGAEPLLRELLAANLYWHRTGGATLGLEEGTNGVILTWPADVRQLDAASFETAVENFVNQAARWRKRIASGSSPAAAPAVPNAFDGMQMPHRHASVIFG